jgi:anthranilate synthase component 2
MIVLIDNYDSFTFNLFHYLGGLGASIVVHRNDKITVSDVLAADPEAIVLSPGPCTPKDAGICLELIQKAAATIPIFGVCLGHQAIGQAFGGEVIRAPVPVHGKLSEVKHHGGGVFRGINAPFQATRYHSLIVDRATMPKDLSVTAETDDRLIMGLAHTKLRCTACNSIPKASRRSMVISSCATFSILLLPGTPRTDARCRLPRASGRIEGAA